jgi:hypothetical protein
MNNKLYIINGNLTKKTSFNLLYNINTQGFIWRGFTNKEKQMLPSTAFYGVCNGQGGIGNYEKYDTIQPVFIMGEIGRIAQYINHINKLGKYPFPIPDELSDFIFPHNTGETQFLKNLKERSKIDYYPKSNLLLQAASYVQHYYQGTMLMDFSNNPLKALFFALGEEENYTNDSWLFGMPVNIFQNHKDTISGKKGYRFDLYLPSYYKNIRIQNQEGIFLYHSFDMDLVCKGESFDYINILDIFEKEFKDSDKIELQEIEEKSKKSNFDGSDGRIGITYVLLKISKEEKPYLKYYLNSVGIDDNFMMGKAMRG